jgi:hypothetical protein
MSYPESPKRRSRKTVKIALSVFGGLIALLVVAGIVGGGSTPAPAGNIIGKVGSPFTHPSLTRDDPAAPVAAAPMDTIVYTITGGRSQDITFIGPGGSLNESQVTDVTPLPWTKTYTVPAGTEGPLMTLSAQNAGGGEIGCSISVNGQVQSTNTSTGEFAIVACNGFTS